MCVLFHLSAYNMLRLEILWAITRFNYCWQFHCTGRYFHSFVFLGAAYAQLLCLISYAGRDSNAQNMGKKGSWFSAIKRVFTLHSKEKLANVSDLVAMVFVGSYWKEKWNFFAVE